MALMAWLLVSEMARMLLGGGMTAGALRLRDEWGGAGADAG